MHILAILFQHLFQILEFWKKLKFADCMTNARIICLYIYIKTYAYDTCNMSKMNVAGRK